MFVVYWLEQDADPGRQSDRAQAQARSFNSDQMKEALAFMEQLRHRQRSGEAVGFVTMCSENPHSVGLPGVADPALDYDWKKRRR